MWKKLLKKSNLNVPKRWTSIVLESVVKKEKPTDPELATAKSFDDIPHEISLPFIGTTWAYLPVIGKYNPSKMHETVMRRYLQYGKIVREDLLPNVTFLHVYDVKDIEKMFRYEGRYPNRPSVEGIKWYREKRSDVYPHTGLIMEVGETWYQLRSRSQKHLMRPASVYYYLPGMDAVAIEMVQRMERIADKNNEVPDLHSELYKFGLESVSLVALDAKLNLLNDDVGDHSENLKLIKAVHDLFTISYRLEMSFFKLWKRFRTPINKKFVEVSDIFTDLAQKHLNRAIEKLNTKPEERTTTTLLENFLLKEGISMGEVMTLISDMFFGGIDTTTHSTAFVLYFLSKNQDCQEKLYSEICQLLPDPKAPITVPVLNESRYLKACVKESMRLKPIINGTVRILEEDIVLSGYRIPAGVQILAQTVVSSKLEEYFPEPSEFKPERWIRGNTEVEKGRPFAFLPFGFGPRSCIGRRIAEQEMWTLLIRILQKYRVEYHHEDLDCYTRLVNTPDKPLRFTFLSR